MTSALVKLKRMHMPFHLSMQCIYRTPRLPSRFSLDIPLDQLRRLRFDFINLCLSALGSFEKAPDCYYQRPRSIVSGSAPAQNPLSRSMAIFNKSDAGSSTRRAQ